MLILIIKKIEKYIKYKDANINYQKKLNNIFNIQILILKY